MRIYSYTGVADAGAECSNCPWVATSHKNAMATAKRHADAHGHTVQAWQHVVATYSPDPPGPDGRRPT